MTEYEKQTVVNLIEGMTIEEKIIALRTLMSDKDVSYAMKYSRQSLKGLGGIQNENY